MGNCNPISYGRVGENGEIPWQYNKSQDSRVAENAISAANEILSKEPVSTSGMDDTLAVKWWLNSLPSGLPYTQYLKDTYTAENEATFNASVSVDYIGTHSDLIDADKITYDGLSGNPIGTVDGDPMLSPDWKWDDPRYSDSRFNSYNCNGVVDTSGLFCYKTKPVDLALVSGLLLSAHEARREISEILEPARESILSAIEQISADFLASANSYIATASTRVKTTNLSAASAFSAVYSQENVQETVNQMISAANEEMEMQFTALAAAGAAGGAAESNAAAAESEALSLLPANFPKIKLPELIDIPLEMVFEAAEGIPWTPPEPHMTIEVDWWQWIMNNLIIILNKIVTTIIANMGIVIPIWGAGKALQLGNAHVPPALVCEGGFKAGNDTASWADIENIDARIFGAGSWMSRVWFVDIPIPWIFPGLSTPSPSVNIETSENKSYLDPEPGEFEEKSVDFEFEPTETESSAQSTPKFDSASIRSTVRRAMECEYDMLKSTYEKYSCRYSLTLLETFGNKC